jgi:hypothetical protein
VSSPRPLDLLDQIIETFAERIAQKLAAANSNASSHPTHYTLDTLPDGYARRTIADAHRRGEIGHKIGRRVVISHEELVAWTETHGRRPQRVASPSIDATDADLESAADAAIDAAFARRRGPRKAGAR